MHAVSMYTSCSLFSAVRDRAPKEQTLRAFSEGDRLSGRRKPACEVSTCYADFLVQHCTIAPKSTRHTIEIAISQYICTLFTVFRCAIARNRRVSPSAVGCFHRSSLVGALPSLAAENSAVVASAPLQPLPCVAAELSQPLVPRLSRSRDPTGKLATADQADSRHWPLRRQVSSQPHTQPATPRRQLRRS